MQDSVPAIAEIVGMLEQTVERDVGLRRVVEVDAEVDAEEEDVVVVVIRMSKQYGILLRGSK